MRGSGRVAWLFSVAAASTLPATAWGGNPQITSFVVANVDVPTAIAHAPGDFTRVFVAGRSGPISVIKDQAVLPDPFPDISALVRDNVNEQGLLGLAFHPDYQTNGFFYVNYTSEPDGDTVIARYQVTADPDVADPAGAQTVLTIAQPGNRHNGGFLGFGPHDDHLYIATGDGAAMGGFVNAQDINSLLGKLLRIDVNCDDFPADPLRNYGIPPGNPFVGVDGADEVWAYGLRNPWRCSFDRETFDLYIGDVGSNNWEELSFRAAGSTGGENYGWPCMEGEACTGLGFCTCNDPILVDPIFVYPNPVDASAAIIGGYVYRGCAIPDLVGAYIFGDHRISVGGKIWQLRHAAGVITELLEIQDDLDPGPGVQLNKITTFGEDAFGELYFGDAGGSEIFKIISADPVEPDCNNNGVADACDIVGPTSTDVDGNGVPDECDCPWDLDDSADVGITDFLALLAAWGPNPGHRADFDGDGIVGIADFLALLANWGPCF